MARSGGFNVPADYFKQPNVIVPATPPSPSKKQPRYVLYAGVGVAVFAVLSIVAFGAISNGTPAPKPADPRPARAPRRRPPRRRPPRAPPPSPRR